MSDYGTFITSPLWERTDPEAIAYFRAQEWTEVRGDKGSIAFAGVLRDLSVAGIEGQVRGITNDLAEVMPGEADLTITLSFERGIKDEPATFSVSSARWEGTEAKRAFEIKAQQAKAMHERAERDARENEASPSPNLDEFLKGAKR